MIQDKYIKYRQFRIYTSNEYFNTAWILIIDIYANEK